MREEELLQKIRESAEHVPVPGELEPEQMMEKLRRLDEDEAQTGNREADRDEAQTEVQTGIQDTSQIKYIRRRKIYQYGLAAAACLALVTLIGRQQLMERMASGGDFATQTTAAATDVVAMEAAEAGQAEGAEAAQAAGSAETETKAPLTEAADAKKYRAKDYGDIYDRFQDYLKEQERQAQDPLWGVGSQLTSGSVDLADGALGETAAAVAEAASEDAAPESGIETSLSGSGDYSETNIQVEGVDEGDIVKTDGTYIYAASMERGSIRIIRPEGEKLTLISEIADTSTVAESKPIQEFYINGDTLSVIRSAWSERSSKPVVYMETYSMKEAEKPELLGTIRVDGYYRSSRRNGDYLYIFSRYEADPYAREDEREKYIPCINGETIPAEDIYMPEIIRDYGYTVVTAVDLRKPEQPVKTKSIMGGSEQFYVSSENIYITASKYDYKASQYDYTEIMKLGYQDGQIAFQAHGTVDGYLNDQFSMDEYQGNLRVVSTLSHRSGVETNSLLVLDPELKVIGEIEDLAPDEQIYSARFMEDTAYFVTYRNMDPLFSADLSDPENPKILGELKITGFSEYLHPFADGLLLGIGQETDPDTGNFKGLKLSMFDVSDPKHVTEEDKTVEKAYENTPAWHNHKSVTISADKNIIGFAVEACENREWKNYYVVYGYEKGKGFTRLLSYELPESEEDNYYYSYDDTRGIYIGDWFYVVEKGSVTSFDRKDFSKKQVLKYES